MKWGTDLACSLEWVGEGEFSWPLPLLQASQTMALTRADSLIDSISCPCRPWVGHGDSGVSGQALRCVALSQVAQLSGSMPRAASPYTLLTRGARTAAGPYQGRTS